MIVEITQKILLMKEVNIKYSKNFDLQDHTNIGWWLNSCYLISYSYTSNRVLLGTVRYI